MAGSRIKGITVKIGGDNTRISISLLGLTVSKNFFNPFLENEKNEDVTLRSLHKTLIYFIFDNHKLSALFVNKTDWFLKIN